MRLSVCAAQQHRSSLKTLFGSLLHCRLLPSERGLGAALGCSPEPWHVSESLVRCWEGAECQAFDCLRISGLFSLHIKEGELLHSDSVEKISLWRIGYRVVRAYCLCGGYEQSISNLGECCLFFLSHCIEWNQWNWTKPHCFDRDVIYKWLQHDLISCCTQSETFPDYRPVRSYSNSMTLPLVAALQKLKMTVAFVCESLMTDHALHKLSW